MKLHFTSGYHPEGDRQTEQANQTLEQYLRMYCNYQQDNWSDLLPLTEFAYNNAPSTTTGVSLFFVNKGYHLNLAVHPECDLSSAWAREYMVDLESLHEYLCEEMAAAQKRYQGPADARRSPAPDFKFGAKSLSKPSTLGLPDHQRNSPRKISVPTQLLPKSATYHSQSISPTLCMLSTPSSTPNTILNRSQPSPSPIEVDSEPEFEITEILNSKFDRCRRQCPLLYLVRWAGYEGTDKETSWLITTELGHASELVADYHKAYPTKPGPLESLSH